MHQLECVNTFVISFSFLFLFCQLEKLSFNLHHIKLIMTTENKQVNEIDLAGTKSPSNEANLTVQINDDANLYANEFDDDNDTNANQQKNHVRNKTRKEDYLKRMVTQLSLAKLNKKKIKYEKILSQSPGTVWYLANRYGVVKELSCSEYIRHYLPYPLVYIASYLAQLAILLLIEYEYRSSSGSSNSSSSTSSAIVSVFSSSTTTLSPMAKPITTMIPPTTSDTNSTQLPNSILFIARFMAIAVLFAYILKTGKNKQSVKFIF